MIARIWHGATEATKQVDYWELLQRTGVPDYQAVEGNKGVYALSRIEGNTAHFLLVTLWENIDAIRTFAGDDIEKAYYYPEDDEFLLEKEPTVTHYNVLTAV